MFKEGQGFYRFKFEDFGSDMHVSKDFFTAVSVEEFKPGCVWYRFKCKANPEATYKDGLRCTFDESLFGTVKSSGSAIYVNLKDDDEEQAIHLVKAYLENRIATIMKNLESAQCKLSSIESYEACRNGFSLNL